MRYGSCGGLVDEDGESNSRILPILCNRAVSAQHLRIESNKIYRTTSVIAMPRRKE
jgi:hypothetical protein